MTRGMCRRMLLLLLLIALLFIPAAPAAASAQRISLDARAVRAVAPEPGALGINSDYLTDHDLSLATLAAMGVRSLRYGADQLIWSTAPYDAPRPTPARVGAWEWPSGDATLIRQSDGTTWLRPPLDLDGASVLARGLGGGLTIIVPLDTAFAGPLGSGDELTRVVPTLDTLEASAVAMAVYAKAHAIPVLAYEIGNESYQPSFDGHPTIDQYVAALRRFSRAIKAADPSATIAANGTRAWWPTILAQAGGAIDALSVHSYPAYPYADYASYQRSSAALTSAITDAKAALGSRKLPILVTEIGAMAWNVWPDRNDMGHAVFLADAIAQTLYQGVGVVQLWNTTWIKSSAAGHVSLYDALRPDGTRTASGDTLAMIAPFAGGSMLTTASTSTVRVFASRGADGGVRVLLLNKDTRSRSITLSLTHYAASSAAHARQLAGTGSGDEAPQLRALADWPIRSGAIAATLPPVSITVLQIAGRAT